MFPAQLRHVLTAKHAPELILLFRKLVFRNFDIESGIHNQHLHSTLQNFNLVINIKQFIITIAQESITIC